MQSALAIHVISKRTVQGVNIVVGEYVLQIVLLEHRVSQTPTVAWRMFILTVIVFSIP